MFDNEEIIKRGYVFKDEYELIFQIFQHKLEKLKLIDDDGFTESLWVFPLENSNEPNEKFHFIFCNDPVMFRGGPRPIAGMVGIATSNGKEKRASSKATECIKIFENAGEEAVNYFWKIYNDEQI